MVIQGTLHLIGYDHTKPEDAREMERLEISLLENLGYTNPYYR
jgi:probable rRNA maturation factor